MGDQKPVVPKCEGYTHYIGPTFCFQANLCIGCILFWGRTPPSGRSARFPPIFAAMLPGKRHVSLWRKWGDGRGVSFSPQTLDAPYTSEFGRRNTGASLVQGGCLPRNGLNLAQNDQQYQDHTINPLEYAHTPSARPIRAESLFPSAGLFGIMGA